MNMSKFIAYQKRYGIRGYQEAINSGTAWNQSPQFAQRCKDLLKSGACILPKKSYNIHFHSVVPSRYEVPRGSVGTLKYAKKYWENSWNISQLIGQQFNDKVICEIID